MTEGASNWASSGTLGNIPNAASNWRAKRHHEEARRPHPAKLRSMSMFFAIGFGRPTQRLLGKWAERTPTPAEAPRRQEPGPRGADAYQTRPTQESNAGHGGGVPSGEDKQADKAPALKL
jgi:hypothetical protein